MVIENNNRPVCFNLESVANDDEVSPEFEANSRKHRPSVFKCKTPPSNSSTLRRLSRMISDDPMGGSFDFY